jgi:hypothetical protein
MVLELNIGLVDIGTKNLSGRKAWKELPRIDGSCVDRKTPGGADNHDR